LIPGLDHTLSMSLNQLKGDENFTTCSYDYRTMMNFLEIVDNAPGGKINYSRWILTGNLFAASEIAAENNYGRAGIFTDQNGVRHRAILCRASVNKELLMKCRVPITTAEEATEIFMERFLTSSGNIKLDNDFSISYRNGEITLNTPGTKTEGGGVFMNKNLINALGSEFSGSRTRMSIKFIADYNKVLAMMKCLYENKLTLTRPIEKVNTPKMS